METKITRSARAELVQALREAIWAQTARGEHRAPYVLVLAGALFWTITGS